MRFASLGGQSNYAQAGKAVANDASKIFKAARRNSVDFDGLAQSAMKNKSNENIAQTKADLHVKKAEFKEEGRKQKMRGAKAGVMRKAGGLIALGVGGLAEKADKSDYSSMQSRIDRDRAKATELRTEAESMTLPETPKASTPGNTGGTAVSSSPSPSPSGSSSAQPVATGGTLDFASVKAHAAQAGAKYPELVAAQWALESGWGKSPSGTNNYFGIKATSGEAATSHQTWEVRNGKDVTETARFKNFDTPQGSINEVVSKWHKDYGNYSGVNNAGSAFDAADMLRTQGYATDPAYSKKLQQIMRDNS
jgi:flagellum-specific peptidoglycan hydrolase FlgJ